MPQSKLLVMAGGTGGHVFPGLAVASQMKADGWHVDWLGTKDRMEADLVPKHGFDIHFVDIAGVRGKSVITKLFTPFRLFKALLQARKLMKSIKPNVVLGMGGYASGPGGLAAKLLGIPLVIHEQNAVFGLTNRYLGKLANKCLTGFDFSLLRANDVNTDKNKSLPRDLIHVGNPIRKGFFEIKEKALTTEQAALHQTNILVIGGSLGALALNQSVPKVIKTLIDDLADYSINIVHQSGKDKAEQVKLAYQGMRQVKVAEFIDDVVASFDWADIIICRAGALSVAEVAGAGRAAIFVPLPIAVDDHQTVNAQYLSQHDAAILIQQPQLDNDLYGHLHTLITQVDKRQKMAKAAKALAKHDASQKVCDIILQIAKQKAQSSMQEGHR
jgi:UDP-N-acetylglucosamine--N-acetylmuramyl-(pentapeptide) pyrophosphoryl-undecaprenol N-acetylglucosamine transferase